MLSLTLRLAPPWHPKGRSLHQALTALQRQSTLAQKECHPDFLFQEHFCKHKELVNLRTKHNLIFLTDFYFKYWFFWNRLPQSSGRQKSGWLSIIIHIWYCANGIWDLVVHNCIHVNSDRIFCQYLLKCKNRLEVLYRSINTH